MLHFASSSRIFIEASAMREMKALRSMGASSAGTLTTVPSGPIHRLASSAIAIAMPPVVVRSLIIFTAPIQFVEYLQINSVRTPRQATVPHNLLFATAGLCRIGREWSRWFHLKTPESSGFCLQISHPSNGLNTWRFTRNEKVISSILIGSSG